MPNPIEHASVPVHPSPIEVVALASSAGGLAALTYILSKLPKDFCAAIAIVQHIDPHHPSLMADILARRTHLIVKEAREGDRLKPGTALVAPPDRHLLINEDGSISLTHTQLVHFVRPSADLLFESVAAAYGSRAIAVVLTGGGSDGSLGVQAIKNKGGLVLVQEASSAQFGSMPTAAIQTGAVDLILPLEKIPEALMTLVPRRV